MRRVPDHRPPGCARVWGAALSMLMLVACDREPAALPDEAARPEAMRGDDFPTCGGALKPGGAPAFFERLEQALQNGGPVPVSFYHETVVILSEGRSLTFRRDDFRPGARALLSNDQWREIADRGFRDLADVGWRGCILGDGKAGFQSDANGELGLSSFDKDRAWSLARSH
jgi:hypothetical protein